MLIHLALWCLFLVLVLIVSLRLTDIYGKDNESARKSVHIIHGIGLAGFAFILPLQAIIIIEFFFLLSLIIARYLYSHFNTVAWIKYLGGRMYKVGRVSFGEFFLPISAVILVFIAESKWEFATVILILGLADAAAALVGKKWGRSNSYVILGQRKSLIGSAAFFVVTCAIVGAFMALHGSALTVVGIGTVAWIAFVLSAAENFGVYGSDNLLIPLIGIFLLNRL